jgi:alpha-ribazole phosphatase
MDVFIIRHTRVAVGKDICYGQYNVPLADTFQDEAAAYQSQLPTDFDAVFCSPLNRCQALAEALQLTNVQYDNRLMEYNFGDWENQRWNDLPQAALNDWMLDFVNIPAPNGENLNQFFERTSQFLDELRTQNHSKVLIVAHSGIVRCLWAYLLAMPLNNMFKVPVGFGEIMHIQLGQSAAFDSILRTK